MTRLRAETADAHARVDACVDLDHLSRAGYVAMLRGLYYGQRAVERALVPHADVLRAYDYDLAERRKLDRLEGDLAALGERIETLRSADIALADAAAAFGAVYVVEGSTLGARFIARRAESLGVTPANGGAYLEGYGERTGAMWRRTGASIAAFVARHPGSESAMLDAARATFALFEAELTRESASARQG